jgi:SAM-dependent methyltransferase
MACQSANLDYRCSHLRLGQEYEAELAGDPLANYLMEREAELLGRLVPRLFPTGIGRYLDFACGTGRIAHLLEPLARQSYGIDISPGMLETARRRCRRTTFLLCDITRAKVSLLPVQLVTAFRFFGNAQEVLRHEALRALAGLVAPGGYLILNNHRNPVALQHLLLRLTGRPLPEYQGRAVDLRPWNLRGLLARYGFHLCKSYGIGLWVFRASLQRPAVLNSRWAALFEPLSTLPFVSVFCPDAVIVARRM